MGIKSLSLQMIPWWCFHVVGVTCRPESPRSGPTPARAVRLIGSDGRVMVYRRAVHAAELMAEHPRHLICRSDSFYIGRKVPALSAADELQPGHSYFLLPTHFFHSVLSFVTVAASLATPNPNPSGGSKSRPLMRPFDIHKTAAGMLQIRVSDEFIERIKEEEEAEAEEEERRQSRVCTTAALEKDYKQLVRCKSRQWKPKLETIRESERKRSAWSRRFKRRKKKSQQCAES